MVAQEYCLAITCNLEFPYNLLFKNNFLLKIDLDSCISNSEKEFSNPNGLIKLCGQESKKLIKLAELKDNDIEYYKTLLCFFVVISSYSFHKISSSFTIRKIFGT